MTINFVLQRNAELSNVSYTVEVDDKGFRLSGVVASGSHCVT